jgi:exodeoxyribonuclease V alpha subunit
MGIPADDPRRVRSAVLYALNDMTEEGSTFAYEDEFTEDLAGKLDVERETVSAAVFDLVMDGLVIKERLEGRVILMHWYLRELEQQAAGKLFALAHAPLPHISGSAEYLISMSEKESGIALSEKQKSAVVSSLKNGVSVITGGPGTGKTTIINTLLAVLEGTGIKTLLAAPTGRAAKRMSQATGQKASTVHRMLEATYIEGEDRMRFMKDEDSPLDCGCVIIDEMSMVDIILMSAILAAIRPGTRLIMVGDAAQLPSVGPGSVLKDIIESDTIHSTRLTEIFRQAEESAIITNAHAVNRGEYPVFNEKNSDFFLMEKADQGEVLSLIKELCAKRLPAFYKELDPFSDIQVLTPTKKDLLGTRSLNRELQAVLNPPSPDKQELAFGEKIFREGDKVIQNKNDYSLEWISAKDLESGQGVFNGDIGLVRSIDREYGRMTVAYDDERLVTYDLSSLDELDMAYALTVHKSQGCEFPVVVMPVCVYMPFLTTRNLFYTAITRAKQAVVLVGRSRLCRAMVDNDSVRTRNSGLGLRLRKLWDHEYGDVMDQAP